GTHPALRRAGVRPSRVELGQHRSAGPLTGLDGCAHARATRTDDHHVVLVNLHGLLAPVVVGQMFGSKVKITSVPSTRMTAIETYSSIFSQKRVLPLRAGRKSTRLNSSHVKISYAVFCL